MAHRRPKMIKTRAGPSMPQMRMPIAAQVVKHELPVEIQKEIKDFQIIWPSYLNSALTRAEGRCVPTAKAVYKPTLKEIVDGLTALGFRAIAEPDKRYPRDILEFGRVRVRIRENKQPINPELPTKLSVLYKLSEHIKAKPGRPQAPTASTTAAASSSGRRR